MLVELWVFLSNHLAYRIIPTTGNTAIAIPTKSIKPRSTLNKPATPKGPGVGGTVWCVTTKPPARATPKVKSERLPFFANALATG